MTINSTPITKTGSLNTTTNVVTIPSTTSSGTVTLTVPQSDQVTRMACNGVLLPYGGVSSTSELVLRNESAVEVDAQYDVNARWPDGSIRSVQVTAAVTGSSTTDVDYTLDYGAGQTQGSYSSNLSLTDNANDYTVENGLVKIVLDKTTGDLIKTIHADTASDDSYATQLTGATQFAYDDVLNAATYASVYDTAPTWEILRNGINLIEFKATVTLKTSGATDGLKLITQIQIFNEISGVSFTEVNIQHTIEDDATDSSTRGGFFAADYSDSKVVEQSLSEIRTTLDVTPSAATSLIMGGEDTAGSTNLVETLDRAGGDSRTLRQTGTYLYNDNRVINSDVNGTSSSSSGVSQTFTGPISGSRCKGYASLSSGSLGVAIMPMHFWQNWPESIEANQDGFLYKHYDGPDSPTHETTFLLDGFFNRPQSFYALGKGQAKTYSYKLILDPTAAITESDLENIFTTYHDYTPTLNQDLTSRCTSNAVDTLVPTNATSSLRDTTLLSNVLERSETNTPELNLQYGWRDFGGHQRPGGNQTLAGRGVPTWYDDTHIGADNYLTMWLRTGSYKWLRFATDSARQFMDITLCHSPTSGIGAYNQLSQPIPAGMPNIVKHDNPDHYGGIQEQGHLVTGGLATLYLITGNQRYYDCLEKLAAWTKHLVQGKYNTLPRPTTEAKLGVAGAREATSANRDHGYYLDIANQWVKISNDATYFNDVNKLCVDFWVDWWQTKIDHVQDGNVVSFNDWEAGTGFWYPDYMTNSPASSTNRTYNGTVPFMDASMFYTTMQFIEMDEQYNTGIDRDICKMMLYQVMEYIFTWGYLDEYESFVYTEYNQPPYSSLNLSVDSIYLLCGPFARVLRWMVDDYRSGALTDTEKTWFRPNYYRTKLLYHLNTFKTVSFQFQSLGFYGYELILKSLFWTHIEAVEAMDLSDIAT